MPEAEQKNRFCPNCGAEISQSDIQCQYCGFPLLDKRKIILLDKEISDLEEKYNELKELIPKKFYHFFMPLAIALFASVFSVICLNLYFIWEVYCSGFYYVFELLILIFFLFLPEEGFNFYLKFFKTKKDFIKQVDLFSKKYNQNQTIKRLLAKYNSEIIKNQYLKRQFVYSSLLTLFLLIGSLVVFGVHKPDYTHLTIYPKKYVVLGAPDTKYYMPANDTLIIESRKIDLFFTDKDIKTVLNIRFRHPEVYSGYKLIIRLKFYCGGKDLVPCVEYLQTDGLEGVVYPSENSDIYKVRFFYTVSVLKPYKEIYRGLSSCRDNIKVRIDVKIIKKTDDEY